MADLKPRGFTILTDCASVDEFVDQFHGQTAGKTLFISAIDARIAGAPCGFAILLANRQPVIAGICEVLEIFRDANNPFFHPGMQLAIKRLGEDSERVFARLEAARAKLATTNAIAPPKLKLVVQMPPAPEEPARPRDKALRTPPRGTPAVVGPEALATPAPRSAIPRAITAEGSSDTPSRAPSSPVVVPANPLMNLTDDSLGGFIDCTLSDRIAIPTPADATQESAPTLARPAMPKFVRPSPITRRPVHDHGQESGPTIARSRAGHEGPNIVQASAEESGSTSEPGHESGPTFVRSRAEHESGPTFVRSRAGHESGLKTVRAGAEASGSTIEHAAGHESGPTFVRSRGGHESGPAFAAHESGPSPRSAPTFVPVAGAPAPAILVDEPTAAPSTFPEGSAVVPPVRDDAPPARPVVRHVGPRPLTLMMIGAAIAAAVGGILLYL